MPKDVWHRFVGKSVDGHFRPLSKDRLEVALRELEGKTVEVAIRQARHARTLPQNSKLHVLARLIALHSGETELRVKRLATLEALGLEAGTTRETILGRDIYEVRHSSDLTKEELSAVIERLLDHCKFLELAPPPDDVVEVMA